MGCGHRGLSEGSPDILHGVRHLGVWVEDVMLAIHRFALHGAWQAPHLCVHSSSPIIILRGKAAPPPFYR